MYCSECGAYALINERRCRVCKADFIYADIKHDSPVIEAKPSHSVSDFKINKMGYYNFLVWTQLPCTMLTIIMIATMLITGLSIGDIRFSTGLKSFDYTYAAIYITTYLPFAIYLEYGMLRFKNNLGTVFIVFTGFQLLIQGIISAALYYAYGVYPDVKMLIIMDIFRIVIWTILAAAYLKSRKGVFSQLRADKEVWHNADKKNMVIYNLLTWSFYPVLIATYMVMLVMYVYYCIKYSEKEMIEELSMNTRYIFVQLSLILIELTALVWIFIKLINKRIKLITMIIANIICALVEAGRVLFDLRFYEDSAKELLKADSIYIILTCVFLILASLGGVYVARRENEIKGGKKVYRKIWYVRG